MLTASLLTTAARLHGAVLATTGGDGIIKQPSTDGNTPFLELIFTVTSWVFTIVLAVSVLIFLLGMLAVLLGSLASMSQVKGIGWKAAGFSLIVVVLSGSAAAILLAVGKLHY